MRSVRPTPAPVIGSVMPDCDRAHRALRVSSHPEAGLIVLSVWDDAHCTTTVRLRPGDVPELLRALSTAAVVAAATPVAAAS